MNTPKTTKSAKKTLRHELEGKIEGMLVPVYTAPDKKIKKLVKKAAKLLSEGLHTKKTAPVKPAQPAAKPVKKKTAVKKKAAVK